LAFEVWNRIITGLSRSASAALILPTVIASEAKQSIVPRDRPMECFVAALLAMTLNKKDDVAWRHA
jgi:hypothetical protein